MKSIFVLFVVCILTACSGSEIEDADGGPEEGNTLVYIFDGSISCDFKGYSEQETANWLTEEGIDVLSSSCGVFPGGFAAICGTPLSKFNIHQIRSESLDDALTIGFLDLTNLQIKYEDVECD